jgi:IS5 family transposase
VGHDPNRFLKGRDGDHANAVLTATGYNLRLVLKWLRILLPKILVAIRNDLCAGTAQNPAS